MPKIKDIHARLIKNPGEYSGFSFLVAERVFLIVTTLYFLTFLGTIGGFYLSWLPLSTMSMISFHLHSLMILTTIWFGFAWAEYITFIYTPTKQWLAYVVLGFLIILGGTGLYVHLAPIFI